MGFLARLRRALRGDSRALLAESRRLTAESTDRQRQTRDAQTAVQRALGATGNPIRDRLAGSPPERRP